MASQAPPDSQDGRPSSPTPSAQAIMGSGHSRAHFRPRRRSTINSVPSDATERSAERRQPRKSAIETIREAAEGIRRDMKGIAQQLKLAAPQTPIADVVPRQETRLRAVSNTHDDVASFYLNEAFFRPEERVFNLVSRVPTGRSSESVLLEHGDLNRNDPSVGPFRNPAHEWGDEPPTPRKEEDEVESEGEKVLLQSWLLIKNNAKPGPCFFNWIARFFILVDGSLVCLSETGGQVWRLRLAGARVREPASDLERVDPMHFVVDFRDVHSALPAVAPFDEIGTSVHLRASSIELKHTWMSFLNSQASRHSRFLELRAGQGVFVRIVNASRMMGRQPQLRSESSGSTLAPSGGAETLNEVDEEFTHNMTSTHGQFALEEDQTAFSKYLYLRVMQSTLAKAKEYVESRGYPEHLIEPLAEELGHIQDQVIADHQVMSCDNLNAELDDGPVGEVWHGSGSLRDVHLGLQLIEKSRRSHRRVPTDLSVRPTDSKPSTCGAFGKKLCEKMSTVMISRHMHYNPSASPPTSPTHSWDLRRRSSPSKAAFRNWRAEMNAFEENALEAKEEAVPRRRSLPHRQLIRPLALGKERAGSLRTPEIIVEEAKGDEVKESVELLNVSELGFGFSLTADLRTDQEIIRRLCAQDQSRRRQQEKQFRKHAM